MKSYFFSAKFFVNLSTLYPTHICVVRGRLQRWEGDIMGTSKIPISQLFSELGKIKKYSPALVSKNPNFPSLS